MENNDLVKRLKGKYSLGPIGVKEDRDFGSFTPAICKEAADKIEDLTNRNNKAVEMLIDYGDIDGAHHKDWAILEALKILCGDRFDEVKAEAMAGEDGPETYGFFDDAIAP